MNDLADLKRQYREIEAPPGFAPRVADRLSQPDPGPVWWPRYVAAAAVVLLALPLFLNTEPPATRPVTSLPSLSGLAPQRPEGGISSLGSLRSVSLPALPGRPEPPADQGEPQSSPRAPETDNSELKQSSNKENFHGYA